MSENRFIEIGSRRELFVDDMLLDMTQTTVCHRLNIPRREEIVLVNDAPWEGNISNYFSFFYDTEYGLYRMYYKSGQAYKDSETIKIHSAAQFCYAESRDGIHWEKPCLSLWGDTNILTRDLNIDNFFVFKDENPVCPPQEKYKAISGYGNLWCYPSADGIHFDFEHAKLLMQRGAGNFDSLNTMHWSPELQKYVCFFRSSALMDGTPSSGGDDWSAFKECIRGIMYSSSEDFAHWEDPIPLEYADSYLFEMYTNCISPYFRATHIWIGLPTRYVQRRAWDTNYDVLGGLEARRKRFETSEVGRGGLAVTEALFMASHDGIHWKRYPEAFLRPGPQTEENWLYGGGYPAVGFLECASSVPGEDPRLSFFMPEGRSSEKPNALVRYSLRMDGFVALHADYEENKVVTKPFIFRGNALHINFSTSAAGHLRFILRDYHANTLVSADVFGDSIDRVVPFLNGSVSQLSGVPVIMEVVMSDADLYSIQFSE